MSPWKHSRTSLLVLVSLLSAATIVAAQPAESEPAEAAANAVVPALKLPRISTAGGGFAAKVTAGWEFDVVEAVTVAELGIWDSDGAGLDMEIPVGLWGPNGKLMVSAAVPTGGKAHAVENFRYVKIEPQKLSPGGPYVIAAQYSPGTEEMVISSNHGEFITSGVIRWRKARRSIEPEFGLPPESKEKSDEMPGGFGPGLLLATETRRPDVHYKVREVFPAGTFKTFAVDCQADGTPPPEQQPVVSAFATAEGELRQIVFNDTPLGVGDEALRKLGDEVKKLYPVGKPDRPLIYFASMSSVKEADAQAVAKAVGELFDDRHSKDDGGEILRSSFVRLRPRQAIKEGKFVAADRFRDAGEYVEDRWTGLLWQKDGAAAGKKNFAEANDFAAELKLGELEDWRLPLSEELATIFPADFAPFTNSKYTAGECCKGPAEFASFWTSELDIRARDYAFVYHWYSRGGANNCYGSRNYVYVRCVHNPVK